jgi:hypothetical protein
MRVETDGLTHAFFVDGANNRIGLGVSSPSEFLDVVGPNRSGLPLGASVPAWVNFSAGTFTDQGTGVGGTVTTPWLAYQFASATVDATNTGVTYDDIISLTVVPPGAGVNVTATRTWALWLGGNMNITSGQDIDPSDLNKASIHTGGGISVNKSAQFGVGGSGGKVYIGETSNANMTTGLTINQGAADDEAVALKSSDVAHGLTSIAETDTYYSLKKAGATTGGVIVQAVSDGADTTWRLRTFPRFADTNKTTAANAPIVLETAEHDGAGNQSDMTADANVLVVKARLSGSLVARMLVDEDGDLYSVTAAQAFDDFDDLALIESYDRIRAGFAGWAKEHEQQLIDLKVLGGPVSEGGLTNLSQLTRLLTGAMRQVGKRLDAVESRLALAEARSELAEGGR